MTSAGVLSTMATSRKALKQSGSFIMDACRALIVSYSAGTSATVPPAARIAISSSRPRSKARVARYHGSTFSAVATPNASARPAGSSPATRSVSRNTVACSIPIDAPRPTEGLVQAHASPTASTPVAIGRPPGQKLRMRSSILAMTITRSSSGLPSSQ